MLEKITSFIKHPTNINVLINTVGNYLNVFFSLLFVLILTRIFNPAQYGVFNVLFGIAYVLANVLDFGTTATIYSYLPPLMVERGENMYRFIKSTFFYQSIFSMAIILILFATFPYLDKVFFKTGAPAWELYITAVSVLFFIWQNFVNNLLFAAKKFLKANIYLNIANIIKTLILFLFMASKHVSVGTVIFTFGVVGPIIYFSLLFLQKKDLFFILLKTEVKREEFRFGYTMTYFIASQFYNLGMRMDLFLLSYFGHKRDAGFYGLSQKIILTVITTVISITQVLSPLFSSANTRKQIMRHLKTGFVYMLLPAGLLLLLFITPTWIFALLFTDAFSKTAIITKALSLAYILNAFSSVLMLFLLYTIKKPIYILATNVIFFFIITLGSLYIIPVKGVFGLPTIITIAYAVATVILTIATVYEFKKIPA